MRAAARTLLALAIGVAATPAWSEAVTFADLDGLAVEAHIVREQTNQRDGRTFPVKVETDWALAIGPEQAITVTARTTAHARRKTRRDGPHTGVFRLDQPRPLGSEGDDGALTFADGTLTFIRTYRSGARRLTIRFARTDGGLTCTADFAFARESGSGPVRRESRHTGREVAILAARQVSSTCRVVKQDQATPPAPERRRP